MFNIFWWGEQLKIFVDLFDEDMVELKQITKATSTAAVSVSAPSVQ